jgi:hypothetical protein
MNSLTPQLAALFVATTGVGVLMMFSGVHKSLLEWRNRRRQCPSCGRTVDGRVCRACVER